MEALEALLTRRSVRSYEARMPEQELIDKVMEAGLYAASGKNMQTAIIVEVTNKEVRDRLSVINGEILGVTSDPFYGAPVVLVVLADKSSPNHVYDGALMMGNLMNAAHALGLGSCWINRAKQTFEREDGKQMLKEWGIEGDYEGIGFCILGYATKEGKTAPQSQGKQNPYQLPTEAVGHYVPNVEEVPHASSHHSPNDQLFHQNYKSLSCFQSLLNIIE